MRASGRGLRRPGPSLQLISRAEMGGGGLKRLAARFKSFCTTRWQALLSA